jgi:hypothetical protein
MNSKFNYSSIDMYSKKIGFFFNKNEKIGSLFGLFLTMLYIFLSLILFIQQIIKTIQRREIKVYDTTIYSQEMPFIDVDINKLYFSFALEHPKTADRFIDESIYTAKLAFIEQKKQNEKFVTVQTKYLDIEKCNMENFGKNYQKLFVKDELINSYCIKNFNYSLTLAGSYKYEKISYLRITIYPCTNSSKNNYSCKSQEDIDYYMSSGYFSIVLKDFGLNPSNYSFPVVPTLQDLYTTIDKSLYKNYILNFGITEIHTDSGLINDNINVVKYLQFRKSFENFSFRNIEDYHKGKSVILVQLRLEDTLFIQNRTYTKISEIFSRIGGYMQLMNTIFLLITTIINKIDSEIKIINSIFNFNLKDNKMILKLTTFKDFHSPGVLKINDKTTLFSSKKSINDLKYQEMDNRSKNNLIFKKSENNNNISLLNISNISDNKKASESQCVVKIDNTKNIIYFENINKTAEKSSICKNQNIEEYISYSDKKGTIDLNEQFNLNLISYFCRRGNAKKSRLIKLYNKGNLFYREKMDIVRVFTLQLILEDSIKN